MDPLSADDDWPGVVSDTDDDGSDDDDDGIVVSHDLHTITEGKSVAFANFVHKVAGTIATVFPDVADKIATVFPRTLD